VLPGGEKPFNASLESFLRKEGLGGARHVLDQRMEEMGERAKEPRVLTKEA